MNTMLGFIARFDGEEWVSLIHGETTGKAKARFLRVEPSGMAERSMFRDIRLNRVPGLADRNGRTTRFGRGYGGFVEYLSLLKNQGRTFDKVIAAQEMGRSVRQVERYIEAGQNNGAAELLGELQQ